MCNLTKVIDTKKDLKRSNNGFKRDTLDTKITSLPKGYSFYHDKTIIFNEQYIIHPLNPS